MSDTPPSPVRVVDPTRESFKALFNRVPAEGPVVMLNLLAFHEVAADPPGTPTRSGRQAYGAYSHAVQPLLDEVGARVQWLGHAMHSLVAPAGEEWDEVLLVEYPNRDAFVRMIKSPRYEAIVHHRAAALKDARLIATVKRDTISGRA